VTIIAQTRYVSAENEAPVWDAVVVAGGRGRRLGGRDKPALEVAGRSLLDIALEAVGGARHAVVVGPHRTVDRSVCWAREEPPSGGPLAALAAGVRVLPSGSEVVAVLAADLPAIDATTIHTLVRAVEGDGVVAVDSSGHRQPLLAVYRTAALQGALATIGEPHGQSMRRLVEALKLATLDVGNAAEDIDTPGDLARWQEGRS
jgi:molybdopterin-guanine dinucleotide biosynthesis protein A